LAALPHREDVTPVVRLLTQHIDVLEQELNAVRAERDQAFARGLELLLGGPEAGTLPIDKVAPVQGAERNPLDPSELLRPGLPRGIEGHTPITLASSAEWDLTERSDTGPTLREQIFPARGMADPETEAADLDTHFMAAARRTAQTASRSAMQDQDRARRSLGVRQELPERDGGDRVIRIKRSIDARRPILLGLAASMLAFGALQIVSHQVGRPSAPEIVSAPASEVKLAAIAPPVPQLREPASPASRLEAADPPITAALSSSEAVWPAETAARPQAFVDIAARELEAASLKKTMQPGDATAIYELASRAADGRGMDRDLALAARLFENAAAQGFAPAQYRIGKLYEKGLGVARDAVTAKGWYQRAADNGNALAMHQLGVLIAEGVGGRPDYAAAIAWFRRAAQHGIRDSQFNLAVLLARGLGGAQDLAGSYTWFAIVAAQGDQDAAKKRDEVAARLTPAKLAAAKLAAERWQPQAPETLANEVVRPTQDWSEAPQPKRTASAGRV
jgi:localization factor PodJL